MKAKLIYLLGFIFLSSLTFGQEKKDVDKYLSKLPTDLKRNKEIKQKYLITTDYNDYDMFGNFLNKIRVTAEYTTGLKQGFVQWNNVKVFNWDHTKQNLGPAEKQDFMEGFKYIPSEKMLDPKSFKNFPPNSVRLKNLVWDMIGFESFAWEYFDSLQLNKTFVAKSSNRELNLAGSGTFENKNIQLSWIGITKMNQEICAIIEFTALNNPLNMNNDFVKIKGRSHYWGKIYVSLKDKQIEFASLYEDVVMDVKFANQEKSQKVDTIRKITVDKIL
jgi:hypothetical protein